MVVPFTELGKSGVIVFGDENQKFCSGHIPSELGIGHLRGQRILKLSIQIRGKSTNLESHLPRMAFKAEELGRVLAVCCSENPLKKSSLPAATGLANVPFRFSYSVFLQLRKHTQRALRVQDADQDQFTEMLSSFSSVNLQSWPERERHESLITKQSRLEWA